MRLLRLLSGAVLVGVSAPVLLSGCSSRPGRDTVAAPREGAGEETATEARSSQVEEPIHRDQLRAYLGSKRLLGMLGLERVVIIKSSRNRVTIAAGDSKGPVGEVYYTIQDGWHLKQANERMEYRPGEGWAIWEQ